MNKSISIIRIGILISLFSVGLLFLMGEEPDTASVLQIFFNKGFALACLYWMGKLYGRWSKVDPIIKAYDKWSDDVMDAPNPMYIGDSEENSK